MSLGSTLGRVNRPLGYLREPKDKRDLLVENTLIGAASYPASWDNLAKAFGRKLFRQQAESCTGFGVAQAIYASWLVQGVEEPFLPSPLFMWWNARKQHGFEQVNSGTYIRLVMKACASIGFCPEEKWESLFGADLRRHAVRPSRAAFQAAYDNRLREFEYMRIASTGSERVQAWKAALSQNHPIVFGIPVFEDYVELDRHTAYNGSGTLLGGHAQTALGYDEKGVYGPGTWGPLWGNDGWWHLSWEFIEQWAMDQWTIRVPAYRGGA